MIETVRAFIDAHQAALSLVILAAMFVGFLMERLPATVIAILGACTYLALGILDADGMYSVFSNSAPIVIGAMFVLSGALIRTGVIQRVADAIMKRAEKHPRLAIVEVLVGALFASAFLNNTPVVVVLIPIMMKLAEVTGVSAKKLLMPLSIVAVLGGTLTLIGTSTNLVVDGIVRQAGMERFGIFEITPIGLVTAASGMVGLALMWWLLPSDKPVKGPAGTHDAHQYLTELILGDDDDLVGMTIEAFRDLPRSGRIVGVRRGSAVIHGGNLDHWTLAAGDRVILRIDGATLMTWREQGRFGLGIGSGEPAEGDMVVETMIASNHPAIGQRLIDIPFLQKIRARIIGLDRPAHEPGPDLASVRIRPADRLLVAGGPREVEALRDNPHLIGADLAKVRAFRRGKAWIAVLCMLSVVTLAAFDIMSIGVAAIIAIGVILVTRCIDSEEAWGTIDGDVLILIFAMLAVGLALEQRRGRDDGRLGRTVALGPAGVGIDLRHLFLRADPLRTAQQQCGRGADDAGDARDRLRTRRRSAPAGDRADDRRFRLLRNADRLSDEHHRLCRGRLSLRRFRQDRRSAQYHHRGFDLSGDHRLHDLIG